MGFFVRPLCIQSGTSVALANKPQVLDPDEKALLITDFVVSLLLVTVGVLVILNLKYGVDLGWLSGLGSIGLDAAYAMIGIGGGIVGLDILKLTIQQARHINGLHRLTNQTIPELTRAIEGRESTLESQGARLSQAETELQRRGNEAANAHRQVEEISQQLEAAKALAQQVPQLNSQILELQQQKSIFEQELQQARQQVQQLEQRILEKNQQLQTVEDEKSLSDQRVQELEQLNQEANEKAQQVESLEEEIRLLKQRLEENPK